MIFFHLNFTLRYFIVFLFVCVCSPEQPQRCEPLFVSSGP